MKKIITLFVLINFVLGSGCTIVGMLGTPLDHETKIPAEYKIKQQADGRIVVLVQQQSWLKVQTDLRPVLSEAVNILLWKKAKVNKKSIIGYERLAEYRRVHPDFSSLKPEEVAAGLDAGTVVLIVIEGYRLFEMPLDGYYKGLLKGELDIRSYILDASNGEVLWPKDGRGKLARLALEAERGGKEACAAKLAKAAAHCVVRYFYDCQKDKFRTWGERPDMSKGEEW